MPRHIDADIFYDKIERLYSVSKGTVRTVYRQVLDLICEEETADVKEVKHGKWIKYDMDIPEHPLHCSVCGWSNYHIREKEIEKFGFCPHCGTNMNVMDGDAND